MKDLMEKIERENDEQCKDDLTKTFVDLINERSIPLFDLGISRALHLISEASEEVKGRITFLDMGRME